MAPSSTSPSLLARLHDLDDHEAWSAFEARYRELILRYAMRRGLQPADAEDVRQAVFLGLMSSLRGFVYRPELGRFRDYLGRVAQNAVQRHLGGRGPVPASLSEAAEPAATEPEEAWNEEWRQHHLRLAMESLRRSFQAESLAIFEELLEGRTPEEVALRHATHVDNVYKVKQRVRDRLRELVAQQLDDEEPCGQGG